jgi:Tfp pilus assembly protein PilN
MIRGNLATRPFHQPQAPRGWMLAAALLVAAATIANVGGLLYYTQAQRERQAQAAADDARAAALRAETAAASEAAEPDGTQAIRVQYARELLARRAFSWTEVFDRFETALPASVRITTVRPRAGSDGDVTLEVGVVARSVEDVDLFLTRLEQSGAFGRALASDERVNEQGLVEAAIVAAYVPPDDRESGAVADGSTGEP